MENFIFCAVKVNQGDNEEGSKNIDDDIFLMTIIMIIS